MCCQQFTMAVPPGLRVRWISWAPARPLFAAKMMPMLHIECVKKLSLKDSCSAFWLVTSIGQVFWAVWVLSSSRKIWSMSVAWIWISFAPWEVKMARETVPSPHALSWTMEPEGMEGMRVRLCAAN